MKNPNCNPRATQVIREYLTKHPELPSRTIARHLFSAHPGLWANVELARSGVRACRGAAGNRNRQKCATLAPPSPLSTSKTAIESNPFFLPNSDEREFVPFCVATDHDCKVLILSDIHIPYHTRAALTLALKEGKRRGVEKIILNGDTLDFYQVSDFCKDPSRRRFKDEIEDGRQLLETLRDEFPEAQIVWKDGNHEERYMRYLMRHAPDLIGVNEFRLEVILHLFDLRIDYVTDKRPIRVGKLNVIHGHEYDFGISNPVNPARGLFLRAKVSASCGHFHQTSEHSETNLTEELVTCWSAGCLSDLHPLYKPFNKWNHGFQVVDLAPTGSFHVDNIRIKDGRMY